MDENAEPERLYNFDLVCEVSESYEVEGRRDLELSLSIHRQLADGKSRRWPKYTCMYPNVPKDAADEALALMQVIVEEIKKEGIVLASVVKDDYVGVSGTAISHDQVMVIEQFGTHAAEYLGDCSFGHAEAKGLKTVRARHIRARRVTGALGCNWGPGTPAGEEAK